ncbi:hypothetical protein ACFL6S_25530 [Candidatus Poribacteria bacterium]
MHISVYISRPKRKKPVSTRQTTTLYSFSFILVIVCMLLSSPLLAQTYDPEEEIDLEPKEYHESALRRFEIIFTASIPFTALHSYLTIRTVEMIRQDEFAPSMSKANWNSVGGLTILFSGFIAFWDYMHTRGTEIKDMGIEHTETVPLSLSLPASGIGYAHPIAPREPMLRLLSVKF